jgi:hypothetical protein
LTAMGERLTYASVVASGRHRGATGQIEICFSLLSRYALKGIFTRVRQFRQALNDFISARRGVLPGHVVRQFNRSLGRGKTGDGKLGDNLDNFFEIRHSLLNLHIPREEGQDENLGNLSQ